MAWLLAVGLVLGLLAVVVVIAGGSVMLMESEHGFLAIVWGVVTLSLAVGTGIWWAANHKNPGVHEWRGGSGPATSCEYEVRSESHMVGKVAVYEDVTYTVCRDAR